MTNSLIAVSAELAALVAIPGVLLLIARAVRGPHAPNWLGSEAGAQTLGFVLTGTVAFVVASAIAGLLDLGLGIGRSVATVAGTLLAATILVCLASAAISGRTLRGATAPSAAVPQP